MLLKNVQDLTKELLLFCLAHLEQYSFSLLEKGKGL